MKDKSLKKLMKYLIIDSWKGIIIVNAILLASCILFGFFVFIVNQSKFNQPLSLILITSVELTIILILLAAVGLLIYNIFKTMNQKLFTSEGYLTFTMPVSVDNLLISRLLVNLMWIAFTGIVSFLGLFLFVTISYSKEIVQNGNFFFELISDIASGIEPIMLINIFVEGILHVTFYLITLLFSLSIVNSSSKGKNRVILSVLLFVLIISLSNSFGNSLNLLFSFGLGYGSNTELIFSFGFKNVYIYILNFTDIIYYVGITIGFYFISRYLIKNKLELI